MALNKPAWQSSVVRQGFASHAVDGNRSADNGALSRSATLTQSSPWWIVDLQSEYEIFRMVITLGEGGNIKKHLLNFQNVKEVVFCRTLYLFPKLYISQGILFTVDKDQKLSVAIGNQFDSCEQFDPWNYNAFTHAHEYERTGRTHILTLSEAVRGRYMTVYLNQTGALQLCEVEVCAEPAASGKYKQGPRQAYIKKTRILNLKFLILKFSNIHAEISCRVIDINKSYVFTFSDMLTTVATEDVASPWCLSPGNELVFI